MAVAARVHQKQRGWRAGCRLTRANTCVHKYGCAARDSNPERADQEWTAGAHRTLCLHQRLKNLPGTHATHRGATGTRSTNRSTASLPGRASSVTKRSRAPLAAPPPSGGARAPTRLLHVDSRPCWAGSGAQNWLSASPVSARGRRVGVAASLRAVVPAWGMGRPASGPLTGDGVDQLVLGDRAAGWTSSGSRVPA